MDWDDVSPVNRLSNRESGDTLRIGTICAAESTDVGCDRGSDARVAEELNMSHIPMPR